ncbi:MAG: cytochrome P450, partial [Sphingomonadales bacterium]
MATLAEPLTTTPHVSEETSPRHWSEGRVTAEQLAHIPGEAGPPVIGNLFN